MVEAEDYPPLPVGVRGSLRGEREAAAGGTGCSLQPWHPTSISSPSNNDVHACVLRSRVQDQQPRILALETGVARCLGLRTYLGSSHSLPLIFGGCILEQSWPPSADH